MEAATHELIVCIVNAGFGDAAMDAAKETGARGGTIINARGTSNIEAEKLFNILIHPEKEMVLIIVEPEVRDSILHALYKSVGLGTQGQGIAFSLPIDGIVGFSGNEALRKKP